MAAVKNSWCLRLLTSLSTVLFARTGVVGYILYLLSSRKTEHIIIDSYASCFNEMTTLYQSYKSANIWKKPKRARQIIIFLIDAN